MCIFCKIIKGEIPNKTVLENDNFLAFEDINPQAPIHILVIPKEHVDNFDTISSELMGEMTTFIQEVVKHMGLENGYRLVTNIGEDGCQEVKHLHFHILAGKPIGPLVCK